MERFVVSGAIPYNYITVTKGYKRKKTEKLQDRVPFDIEDLKAIFEQEKSIELLSKKSFMPSRPWGLLIALVTGARASEIFALKLDDIRYDVDTPYFDIYETEGHNRIKNEASVRGVPIHPLLFDLGFENYLKKARRVQSHLPMPMPHYGVQSNKGTKRATRKLATI